jgi:hypothetical protein
MGTLARHMSIAEVRRAAAVGEDGIRLGLAQIPSVVLADFLISAPSCPAWMPLGHVSIDVWANQRDGRMIWQTIQDSPDSRGYVIGLRVWPVTRWARARAWWRWQMHRLEKALEGKR